MKIGVIGLGKLGSILAKVMAKHYHTVGFDIVKRNIKGVDTSINPEILIDCDIIFNVVNTPSLPNGDFDNSYLYESIVLTKPYLNCKIFVVTSTVMPGTCNEVQKLVDCDVCYNPEFIRLTSIEEDMENPDFILIGGELEPS